MKILLVGPQWIGGWLEGMEHAALKLGHQVRVFRYDTPNAPNVARNTLRIVSHIPGAFHPYFLPLAKHVGAAWEGAMNRRLLDVARSLSPELIIILKGETIQIDTVAALRASNRRIVSWWVDDPIRYIPDYPNLLEQLKRMDMVFMFDRGRFKDLQSYGVDRLIFLPCACDPQVYYPRKLVPSDFKRFGCEIGLVASYYPERGTLLKSMKGLDVAIWGYHWGKADEMKDFPPGTWRGSSLAGEYVAAVYNTARICPNIHHSQTLFGGLNMRTYEIPAAGGFELVDDVGGLEEQFEIGREIIVYKSPQHFRELADYYLAHPAEREAFVKRGRARVMRDHTYHQRLGVMLDSIKGM
jgi:spore maturation protein CgeB